MKTFNVKKLVRENILKLQPYSSFRDQNLFKNPVFLDANESPYGDYNRYPDSTQKELKQKLSVLKGISEDQIAVGNGSDELIDLIIKVFCEPKKASVLVMEPSFSMYSFYASINENKVIKLNLNEDFDIVKQDFLNIINNNQLKIFFLCSPNNPTGKSIDDIEFYVKNFSGIVVVDEAYIEFSSQKSCIDLLKKYPNLVVLQTFSKAWGMAGARVGIAYSSKEITKFINTVKSPYNINSLSLAQVIKTIGEREVFKANLKKIREEKVWLENEFQNIQCIKKVFPSDANFFLIKFEDSEKVYQKLLSNHILTSNRNSTIPNCLRINIGNRKENLALIETLKQL